MSFLLVIFAVLVQLCHGAQTCQPPTITHNTLPTTITSNVYYSQQNYNFTAGALGVNSINLAIELPAGAYIHKLGGCSRLPAPLTNVYQLSTNVLNAHQTASIQITVASASQALAAVVSIISMQCSDGSSISPDVCLCDYADYANCVDVMATLGTGQGECYRIDSYFDNIASSINFTASANASCLILYDQPNCTGNHQYFQPGATVLSSFNNITSSFVFTPTCPSILDSSSSSSEEADIDIQFCSDYGFPYQEYYFTFTLTFPNGCIITSNPEQYIDIKISSGGQILSPVDSLGNGVFKVCFTVCGCGVYNISIDSCSSLFVIPHMSNLFTVTEKPAPQLCDIYQHDMDYCGSPYTTSANVSIAPVTFCCEPTETLTYDKRQVIAYDAAIGCPSYSDQIASATVAGNTISFCQTDTSNTLDINYVYACQAFLVYDPNALNCNGTTNCGDNPPPICGAMERLYIIDTVDAAPYPYNGNSQIYMCCSLPPPTRPAFRLGYVYTYDTVTIHNMTSPYPSGNGTRTNSSVTHFVDVTGKINILPVCVDEYLVTSTMTISNLKCNASTTYVNGTVGVTEVHLDDAKCANITTGLSDRSGDKYFYFTQDMNTGQIVSVTYNSNQLALAQSRVGMLQSFEFEISPTLTEFTSSSEEDSGSRRKRDINDPTWTCWYRNVDDEASGRMVLGEKKICINQFGVQLVESTEEFSFGSNAGFQAGNANTTTDYDGIPINSGYTYTLVQINSSEAATPAAVTQRGFTNTEVADYSKLGVNKRDVRKEPLNWKGFEEEIFEEPANVNNYIISKLQIAFLAPAKSESFLTVSQLVERYPLETSILLSDYLDKNPNGSMDIDRLIFGALAHSFTAELEGLFLSMMNSSMSDQRKSLLLHTIAIIRGDKVTDALVTEMHARAELPDADGYTALNILSVMAGQMYHAGKEERAVPLLDTMERKLLESEKAGDEVGILHALHSFGNSHSRRGAPHLVKYLDPDVSSTLEMREHLNKAAAQGLRGVPGSDITSILIHSHSVHVDSAEVKKAIRRSLQERKRNEKQVERLDVNSLDTALWLFERTWGNGNGNVTFYTAADWKLSFQSTYMQAITGFNVSLFDFSFDVMEGGAFIGTTGYAAFNVHLYLEFGIPNPIPLFGGRISYFLFNWGVRYGAELPIRENVDICLPEDPVDAGTAPAWKGIISLPTIPIYFRTVMVLRVVRCTVWITANLFMQYNYEFNFRNGPSLTLGDMQVRVTADPGGRVDALFTAIANVGILEVTIASSVNLITTTLPFTYSVILDGSGTCRALHLQSNFLQGNINALVRSPPLCVFLPNYCSWQDDLTSWSGYSDYQDLDITSCCGAQKKSDLGVTITKPERSNQARVPLPVGTIPVGGTLTSIINAGRTAVTWENYMGIERPTSARSVIGNCTRTACPGGQPTRPSGGVRNALRATGEYITGAPDYMQAGHILAAALGGSNNDILNFFIQKGSVNGGIYRTGFELNILNCLLTNPLYYADIQSYFTYNGVRVATPDTYRSIASFVYQNGTQVPTSGITNIPVGCTTTPTGVFSVALGNANMDFNSGPNY